MIPNPVPTSSASVVSTSSYVVPDLNGGVLHQRRPPMHKSTAAIKMAVAADTVVPVGRAPTPPPPVPAEHDARTRSEGASKVSETIEALNGNVTLVPLLKSGRVSTVECFTTRSALHQSSQKSLYRSFQDTL